VPEINIELEGERGVLPFIAQRVAEQGHAVVVVAEVRTLHTPYLSPYLSSSSPYLGPYLGHAVVVVAEVRPLLLTPCPIRLNISPFTPSHLPQSATHAAHTHTIFSYFNALCALCTPPFFQGAGEELLGESAETDASGNKKLPAIGEFMKNKIVEYFKRGGMEVRCVSVKPLSRPLSRPLSNPYLGPYLTHWRRDGGTEACSLLAPVWPFGSPWFAPSWPLLHTLTDPYESSHEHDATATCTAFAFRRRSSTSTPPT
jgi:hypothetical protein